MLKIIAIKIKKKKIAKLLAIKYNKQRLYLKIFINLYHLSKKEKYIYSDNLLIKEK
jgi:hypothetical protein